MQLLSIISFVGAVSASAVQISGEVVSENALFGLVERQIRFCSPVRPGPNLCERSCGPGYVQCVRPTRCFNPSEGQVCCSDSTACPAGSYCSDKGCCADGITLEECGASVTLSVIPPPSEPTSAPEPSSEEPAPEPTVSEEPEPEPTSSEEPEPEPTSEEPPVSEEPTEVPEPTISEAPTSDDTIVIPEPTLSEEPTSEPTEAPEPTEDSSSAPIPPASSILPTPTPAPTGAAAMNAGSAGIAVVGGLLVNLLLL